MTAAAWDWSQPARVQPASSGRSSGSETALKARKASRTPSTSRMTGWMAAAASGAGPDRGDARRPEPGGRLGQPLRAIVEGVVVGQPEQVKTGGAQRSDGRQGGAQAVGSRPGGAGLCDDAFQVAQGQVGGGQPGGDGGQRVRLVGHAPAEHDVAGSDQLDERLAGLYRQPVAQVQPGIGRQVGCGRPRRRRAGSDHQGLDHEARRTAKGRERTSRPFAP